MLICHKCQTNYASQAPACPSCGWTPPTEDGVTMFAPELAASEEGFADHLFETRGKATEHHFWFTNRDALILGSIARHFPIPKRIMEIGAGSGHVLEKLVTRFPDSNVVGAEISATGLQTARSRCGDRAAYVQLDATALPYDQEFDLIGAFDVLEHIENDRAVLHETLRALAPGGGLIITVPQHPSLWSHKDDVFCHKRRYTADELQAKVAEAGFEVLFTTSFVTLLLPALWWAVKKQRGAGDYRADRELNISPVFNAALGAVLAFERGLIALGLRFPIGGSRLLVARKPKSD